MKEDSLIIAIRSTCANPSPYVYTYRSSHRDLAQRGILKQYYIHYKQLLIPLVSCPSYVNTLVIYKLPLQVPEKNCAVASPTSLFSVPWGCCSFLVRYFTGMCLWIAPLQTCSSDWQSPKMTAVLAHSLVASTMSWRFIPLICLSDSPQVSQLRKSACLCLIGTSWLYTYPELLPPLQSLPNVTIIDKLVCRERSDIVQAIHQHCVRNITEDTVLHCWKYVGESVKPSCIDTYTSSHLQAWLQSPICLPTWASPSYMPYRNSIWYRPLPNSAGLMS